MTLKPDRISTQILEAHPWASFKSVKHQLQRELDCTTWPFLTVFHCFFNCQEPVGAAVVFDPMTVLPCGYSCSRAWPRQYSGSDRVLTGVSGFLTISSTVTRRHTTVTLEYPCFSKLWYDDYALRTSLGYSKKTWSRPTHITAPVFLLLLGPNHGEKWTQLNLIKNQCSLDQTSENSVSQTLHSTDLCFLCWNKLIFFFF